MFRVVILYKQVYSIYHKANCNFDKRIFTDGMHVFLLEQTQAQFNGHERIKKYRLARETRLRYM